MLILSRSNFIRSFFFSLGLSILLTALLVEMASAQQRAATELWIWASGIRRYIRLLSATAGYSRGIA